MLEETDERWSLARDETFSTKLAGLVTIPHSAAMAWAVRAKSPVTCHVLGPKHRDQTSLRMNYHKYSNASTTEG